MEKRPIMIIAAMENTELNVLKKQVSIIRQVEEKTCKFYETELFGYPVVLCCTNVGCIQASAAMVTAIQKYHPIAIINEGLAGATSKEIHQYDMIIGTEVININSVKTPKRKENEGCDVLNWQLVTFIAGEEDKLKIEKASEKLVQQVKKIESEYTKGNVIYGRIGSGDIWNAETDRILALNQQYGILCEEMEGIAIYQIANQYGIPVLNLRIISDNEILGEEYDVRVGIELQDFVIKLIKNIVKC